MICNLHQIPMYIYTPYKINVTENWRGNPEPLVKLGTRLDRINTFKLTTLVVLGNDCIFSCKLNYHTIMTTTAPQKYVWMGCMAGVLYETGTVTLREHLCSFTLLVAVHIAHLFGFLCCIFLFCLYLSLLRGRRCHDRMVVQFTTKNAIIT
jgi:hypothetical protein